MYEIIETAQDTDRLSAAYDWFMIAVIIASLVPLAFHRESPALRIVDKVCVVIFILDYFLRWWTADYKFGSRTARSFLRYPVSPMAMIDLVSILPSLTVVNGSLKLLRLMRMVRAMRVLRVFKAARYSKSVRLIVRVFQKSRAPLAAVGTFAVSYVLISALIIMNVEPDSFRTFFDAVYWATVSLTTVGYGDIYPVTTIGRIVTMLSSIFGIAIVALPAGIITAGYMAELDAQAADSAPDASQTTEPK